MFDSVQSPTLDNSVEANTPIRVLLVDDHAVVRQGLKMFLSLDKDIVVIGEAQNGQEACELTAALKPDIVLMDIIMPIMDGLTAIQKIKNAQPEGTRFSLPVVIDDRHTKLGRDPI